MMTRGTKPRRWRQRQTRSRRDSQPDWSPRADSIAFRRDSVACFGRFRGDIFVAPTRGGGTYRPRRLTTSLDAFSPVWSPDGRYIAYVRAPDSFSHNGSLWIVRATDGGGQRLVARGVTADRISWQPQPDR